MVNRFVPILSCSEVWEIYPNEWVLCRVMKRNGKRVEKVSVLTHSASKLPVIKGFENLKEQGEDVIIIVTNEGLDDAKALAFSDGELHPVPYMTAKEA
ncbi:MAG TPA: hypothetical protein DCE48_13400, partial [Lachnospiraceae bacterium]|nr:hypothetical protein [Lachnospiraceae bacterium]